MREAILRMLADAGEKFVSGSEISSKLGVTRAAVWKHIRALECDGAEIEAVTRKGYRLRREPNLLCTALIEPHLMTRELGRNAVFFVSASSSNLIARQLADRGCESGTIVLVENQTAGRGRRERGWVNTPGLDICVSIVLRPQIETQYAPRFTLATALGVYSMAKGFGLSPAIKWPNDVLIDGRKLCGILLELHGSMETLESIVIGFGVNVNTVSFSKEIANTATSMRIESGTDFSRARVLSALLNTLEPFFDACADEARFQLLLQEYRRCCSTLGKEITITGMNGSMECIASDVDGSGRLLVRDKIGAYHVVAAGDVTLRC